MGFGLLGVRMVCVKFVDGSNVRGLGGVCVEYCVVLWLFACWCLKCEVCVCGVYIVFGAMDLVLGLQLLLVVVSDENSVCVRVCVCACVSLGYL